MPTRNATEIVGDLAELLANFQGREYSDEITADTLFFGDLGFASIDAVVLGEQLQEFYGQKLPFNQFLADCAERNMQDVCLGELAAFLADHFQRPLPAESSGGNGLMSKLVIDDVSIHFHQQGTGPDVILIHAFTGNMSVWALSGIVEALAHKYRVTTYDLRGHGLSGVTPTGYNSRQMAADFYRLHSELQLGPAHLVGHSFGGVIAMHAALDYSQAVSSVILSDTYFPGLHHLEPEMEQTEVWADLREQLRTVGTEIGDRVDFTRLFREIAKWSSQQRDTIKQLMGAPAARWLTQLAPLAETHAGDEMFQVCGLTADRICDVRQPVVAMYDEFSPFVATRDFLQQHLADCQIETVPGAKHLAPVQSPTAFVELVEKHLDRFAM